MFFDLEMIGLQPPSSDIEGFIEQSARSITSQVPCPFGFYAIAEYPGGAELWFHMAVWRSLFGFGPKRKMAVGFTPFHATDTDIFVTIDRFERSETEPIFTGRCHGRAGEGFDDPICFQLVDFPNYSDHETPVAAHASIICLARDAEAFESSEAFLAAQSTEDKMPPVFFLPVGQLSREAGAETGGPQIAVAMLAGRILSAVHREGQTPYMQLKVETLNGTYDVFAGIDTIKGEVRVGGTLRAMGTMFGRLLPA